MADKISHQRPPGSSQRDAAFSHIFGSAPPPGRSQTMNSSVVPPSFENNNTSPPPQTNSPPPNHHEYGGINGSSNNNNFDPISRNGSAGNLRPMRTSPSMDQQQQQQQPIPAHTQQAQQQQPAGGPPSSSSSQHLNTQPPHSLKPGKAPSTGNMNGHFVSGGGGGNNTSRGPASAAAPTNNTPHALHYNPQSPPHSAGGDPRFANYINRPQNGEGHNAPPMVNPDVPKLRTPYPPPGRGQHQQAPPHIPSSSSQPPSSPSRSISTPSFNQPTTVGHNGGSPQQQHSSSGYAQSPIDAPRSMSMTTSSRNNNNNNGNYYYYDRDHRAHTMTMSGRVIPQRQPHEIMPHQQPHNSHSMSTLNHSKSSGSNMAAHWNNGSHNPQKSSSSTDGGSGAKAQRSTSTSSQKTENGVPHSTILTTSRRIPLVYPALLSKVAEVFREKIGLGDRIKNELTYKNSFTGSEAVDLITYVIKTPDRNLALLLGRALDAQKFFHDVTYDHRLRDTPNEVYQFNEIIVDNEEEQQQQQNQLKEEEEDEHSSTSTVAINGVFTLLAECYSATCTRDNLCYSIACPRRLEQQARLNMKPQPGLKRAESRLSLHGDDEKEQKLWIHTVSEEVAASVSDKEKKRQEVICEVIYTERDFVKDLEYLRDFWIKPLRNSNVIPEARRERFIRAVFSHIMEVHSVNVKLAEALTKRQQLAPVVRQIGDVFLEHVPKFEPFIRYGANQLMGKYEFEREKSTNPAFAKFVDETERLKESRKLELNGYLTKPTTRLARYPLLLEAVLKHTEDDNMDHKNIPEAIKSIREFLNRVNVESGKAENRFNLMQLNQQLVFRPGEYVDMRLTDESRKIIFKGFLKKRTQDKENQGDVQVYLFDNSLLFVRVKIINKREQLKVHRKPIPLELLNLAESEEMAPKSLAKRPSSSLIPSAKIPTKVESGNNRYPLTFQHLGRRGYEITFYATTFIGRKKWVEHIDHQKHVLAEKGNVFAQHILRDKFFNSQNRVNCVAPLDGGRKLLYGTDNGIYISDVKMTQGGPSTSVPVKVITLSNVTQLDVLEEYMTLLALSDKSLFSWPLDCLEVPDPVANSRRSKKVMGHINFYKVGICLGRVLVCTVKSSTLTTTVRVMEPFDPQPRGKRQPALSKLLKGQSEGLKMFKEFYIPSEALSISFLKRKLCVGCAKGFEIVDLKTLETQSLLDPADTSLDFVIRKEALKPIAIYPIGRNFLLNYSDFSFFVNCNGWRAQPEWMIHWEGLPQHFAFSYPYIIAFEPNFIEIRHVDTGELVRVVTGENIRFLHESTREVLYVHEDVNGYDEVLSLDFWEKTKNHHDEHNNNNDNDNNDPHPRINDDSTTNTTINEENEGGIITSSQRESQETQVEELLN